MEKKQKKNDAEAEDKRRPQRMVILGCLKKKKKKKEKKEKKEREAGRNRYKTQH